MKPNEFNDKGTLVIEKQEKVKSEIATENDKKNILQSSKSQPKMAEKPKINLFSAKTFIAAKQNSEETVLLSSKKIEFSAKTEEKNIEQQKDIDETFVSFSPSKKEKKKEWKFRLILLTAIYCVVIGVLGAWVTTNAIRISNINQTINQTQTEININYAKYIENIAKLDQEPNTDNSSLLPIDEIITVTPLPLEDVTEYEKESNWFDNIVNWFGNLFGG